MNELESLGLEDDLDDLAIDLPCAKDMRDEFAQSCTCTGKAPWGCNLVHAIGIWCQLRIHWHMGNEPTFTDESSARWTQDPWTMIHLA